MVNRDATPVLTLVFDGERDQPSMRVIWILGMAVSDKAENGQGATLTLERQSQPYQGQTTSIDLRSPLAGHFEVGDG